MKNPKKKIAGFIKLEIPAAKANPAPPIGPALGQKGLNIMEFCKAFNDRSKTEEVGTLLRVSITAYVDRTFDFVIRGAPTSVQIKKALKLEKGSATPGRSSAGTITQEQIRSIAEKKMKQGMSARTIEAAMKIVAGSARAMGLKVVEA